jgi:hypothetical protein
MGKEQFRKLGGNNGGNNGGIMGSGIFGIFGTTIRCDSEDNSIYCNIMKIFNLFIMIALILYFLYIASIFLKKR